MTDAFIESRFGNLTVPGKRPLANLPTTVSNPSSVPAWDEKPLTYMMSGESRDFFTIGHLAKALGYSVQSIRAWENKGLLPKSPFRSPKPVREMLPGRTKGKRLWTREQIEGILRIASEEGVILNKKAPNTRFAKRVSDFFMTLVNPTL